MATANALAKLLLSDYLRDQHVSSSHPRINTSELMIEKIVVEYLLYAKTYYTGSKRSEESFNRCRRSHSSRCSTSTTEKKQEIETEVLTNNAADDAAVVDELLDQTNHRTKKFGDDGADDKWKVYRTLARRSMAVRGLRG